MSKPKAERVEAGQMALFRGNRCQIPNWPVDMI